jgi:hypothetical protein
MQDATLREPNNRRHGSRRTRTVALIAVVLALGAGTAACGTPRPELRLVGDGSAGLSMSNRDYDVPASVGAMMLCLTSPGTATITRVALHEPSGDIRVEAFAVRPNPHTRGLDGLGTDTRPLAEIGGGFDPVGIQQVSGVCPTEAELDDSAVSSRLSELGVQLAWSSGDVAGGNGVDVTYEIAGVEATALIPFAMWLCAAACPDDVGASPSP